jgi:hypothetical protein
MTDLIPMGEAMARIGELEAENEQLKARIKIVREADDSGYLVIHVETNKLEELLENAIWGGTSNE